MLKKLFLGLMLGLLFSVKIMAQGVDYYLPYPGLLPDHPLYWLKMVRDRTQLLTTTKPMAKTERLLLYADKRLGAAWALIDGNKQALGMSTLTKAEKYLYEAVDKSRSLSPNEGDVDQLRARLAKAIVKHQEVLRYLKPKAGDNYASMMDEMLIRLDQYQQQFGLVAAPQEVDITVKFSADKTSDQKVAATTAFEVLEKISQEQGWEIKTKDYDFGKLVEAIDGVANTKAKVWIFYVNGEAGDKASDKFELKAGDKIEWQYEAVKP
jgi:hypothetical protein